MSTLLLASALAFLSSCSTTHHHHHYGHQEDRIMQDHRVVHHDYIDYGDHIQVIVKHKPRLTKQDRKRIKKWCRHHYRHHKKRIAYKFVIVK